MTEKPRETQAELHVVELKEKVNNSSLMKHQRSQQHPRAPRESSRYRRSTTERKTSNIFSCNLYSCYPIMRPVHHRVHQVTQPSMRDSVLYRSKG